MTDRISLSAIRAKVVEYYSENSNPLQFLDLDSLRHWDGDRYMVEKISFAKFSGLTLLGSGAYSDVYEIDERRVLKIARRLDSGYAQFVKVARQNAHNPHMPKIFFASEWGGKAIYVLERLEDRRDNVNRMFQEVVRENTRGLGTKPNPFVQIAASVLEAAQLIAGLCNDLHSGNIMFRGDVPVITDPSCM